jgi:GntR family transcriptional regulator/MocR family aminotransferase
MPKRRHSLQNTADLTLNRASAMPLHRQLYDRLRHAIVSDQLHPGQRLPSTRVLASELGISRNTASNAYEQLLAEGYVERKVGHGTWVTCERPDTFFITRPFSQEKTSLYEGKQTQISLSHLGRELTHQSATLSLPR